MIISAADRRPSDGVLRRRVARRQRTDPEDAFVEHDAVDGTLGVVGAEQVFDATAVAPPDPGECDVATTGWG